jgi:uncharacterized protein YcgL (UPF0745 family)
MLCRIYRSGRKEETYLYLRGDLEFGDLPGELQASFGEPHFVMSLVLGPTRKLARVDTGQVLAALDDQGFYLQLPPKLTVEEEIARRFS